MEEALFPGLLLLFDPMDCSSPGFPVLHHLQEFPGLPDCSIKVGQAVKQEGGSWFDESLVN